MKKTILFFASMMLLGCSKQQEINSQAVRFNFRMIESGSMTKVITSDSVLLAINSRIPETLTLTLTNTETSEVKQVVTGQSYELELGEYEVTCDYSGNDKVICHTGTGTYASTYPTIKVDDEITITYDKTSYEVDGTYECCCIAVDNLECSGVKCYNNSADIPFYKLGNHKITFLSGSMGTTTAVALQVKPKTAQYKQQLYTLYNDGGAHSDGYNVENGKWYVLHPYEVTNIEGGVIVNLPDWVEGEL